MPDQTEVNGSLPARVDVIIIGAGIAGASLATFLGGQVSVLVLEQEAQPAYHTTGRSAAIFTEVYGNATIRALTRASRAFFESPGEGFGDGPLWHNIDTYLIGTAEQSAQVSDLFETVRHNATNVTLVSGADFEKNVPLIRGGIVKSAVKDSTSKELDVGAIQQGYLRRFERAGGQVATNARVEAMRLEDGQWTVTTNRGQCVAPVVVNAAGAWADEVAALAGVSPVGLTPMRRSVCLVDAPSGVSVKGWPMTVDVEEKFYFKPESGRILCSPADETPSAPCDAQPEELDLAIGIDRIQRVLDIEVRRIESKWAGLRTFAPDRTPVVGFDPALQGFFWLAGQGGYGIETSPAIGELAAALILGNDLPLLLTRQGIGADTLSPARFSQPISVSG